MQKGTGIALGIPLGAGVGIALGAAFGSIGISIGLAIGVGIGIAIGVVLEAQLAKEKDNSGAGASAPAGTPINPAQVEEKKQNIERVFEKAHTNGRITNNGVQELLGVSDATAERYLSELEGEGKLVQQGNGSAIYYEPR